MTESAEEPTGLIPTRLPKYEYEKLIGVRTETGALKLKKLSANHRRMLSMFCQGVKPADIAQIMCVTAPTVYRVINDPLGQEIIEQHEQRVELELQSLAGPAVDTLRDVMTNASDTLRLKAAEKVLKAVGLLSEDGGQKGSAEDTIQRMMDVIKEQAQVNQTQADNNQHILKNTAPPVLEGDYHNVTDVDE